MDTSTEIMIPQLLRAWLSERENPEEYRTVIAPILEATEKSLRETDSRVLLEQGQRDGTLLMALYNPGDARRGDSPLPRRLNEVGISTEGQRFIVVTTMLGMDESENKQLTTLDRTVMMPFLGKAGEYYFRPRFKVYPLYGGSRVLFLLLFDKGLSENVSQSLALSCCRQINGLFERWLDTPVSFLLSNSFDDFGELYTAYSQTVVCHRYLVANGSCPAFLRYQDVSESLREKQITDHAEYLRILDTLYRRLSECFRLRQFREIAGISNELAQLEQANSDELPIQTVRCHRLVAFLYDNILSLSDLKPEGELKQMLDRLLSVNILYNLSGALEPLLSELSNRYRERPGSQQVLTDSIRQYVLDHYADPDLSVAAVAGYFRLSQGYLASLMKASGEPGLLDTIQDCRVNAARKLLENTDLSISRIAAQVGYAYNAGNLTRVFKRRVGITPQEYRNCFRTGQPLPEPEETPDSVSEEP